MRIVTMEAENDIDSNKSRIDARDHDAAVREFFNRLPELFDRKDRRDRSPLGHGAGPS